MKNLKMELENGKVSGGFSSLTEEQILKIKGGKRNDANPQCTNELQCSGDNAGCTNKSQCS